ncbi:MAG: hypothetical protein ACOX0B_00165 [Minisyncoccales bacterium]|jgi:hypothetical protein
MNKQKTLIFSLSAILFLALSFIVYSWSEPTTNMPSGYTAPLNTSSNFQKKDGPLIFPMMYDGDTCNDPLTENCPYYINPSGNSVIAGKIVTDNPVSAGDFPNTVATKGYVDALFDGIEQEVSLSNLMHIKGTNPLCPKDSVEIIRHYFSRTCGYDSLGCRPSLTSCQTVGDIWVTQTHVPSCTYRTTRDICANTYNETCIANEWDAVICVKN